MSLNQKIVQQIERIKRSAIEILSEEELYKKLEASLEKSIPLRVKAGFDPTSKDIHLGHTVLLNKLRTFQDLGHEVYFIVGDFTAKIGDPSGRNNLRPVLTDSQIEENARTYTDQAFKILDKSKTKIIFNSIWYKDMTLADFLPLLNKYTVSRILERDDFTKRIKQGIALSLLEVVYPIIQGYDSVMMKADIELGGSDQKFNLIVGRHMQEAFDIPAQVVLTLPLLVGLDGKNKMSKSLDNYIGVSEDPKDIFGKLMSISDTLMYDYFSLLTDFDLKEVENMHPKQAKEMLAADIISKLYSKEQAFQEQQRFSQIFSKRDINEENVPTIELEIKTTVLDLLVKERVVTSNNELRRLIKQGGVSFGNQKIDSENFLIETSGILKVGKKKFFNINLK